MNWLNPIAVATPTTAPMTTSARPQRRNFARIAARLAERHANADLAPSIDDGVREEAVRAEHRDQQR
jgi:hypothetical protein